MSWYIMDIPFDEVRYPYCIDCVYDKIIWHILCPYWIDSLYDFTRIVRIACIIYHENLFMMFIVSIFGLLNKEEGINKKE